MDQELRMRLEKMSHEVNSAIEEIRAYLHDDAAHNGAQDPTQLSLTKPQQSGGDIRWSLGWNVWAHRLADLMAAGIVIQAAQGSDAGYRPDLAFGIIEDKIVRQKTAIATGAIHETADIKGKVLTAIPEQLFTDLLRGIKDGEVEEIL